MKPSISKSLSKHLSRDFYRDLSQSFYQGFYWHLARPFFVLVIFYSLLSPIFSWATVGVVLNSSSDTHTSTAEITQVVMARFEQTTTLTLAIKSSALDTSKGLSEIPAKGAPNSTQNNPILILPIPEDSKDIQKGQPHAESLHHLQMWTSPLAIYIKETDPCSHLRFFQKSEGVSAGKQQDQKNLHKKDPNKIQGKIQGQFQGKLTASNNNANSDVILIDEFTDELTYGLTDEPSFEIPTTINKSPLVLLSKRESSNIIESLQTRGYKVETESEIAKALRSIAQRGFLFILIPLNTGPSLEATELVQVTFKSPNKNLNKSPDLNLFPSFANLSKNISGSYSSLYTLSPDGKANLDIVPTIRAPSQVDLPPSVRKILPAVYSAIKANQPAEQEPTTTLLEYAGSTQWCSPCGAEPLSANELQTLGVPAAFVHNSYVTRFHFYPSFKSKNSNSKNPGSKSNDIIALSFSDSEYGQPFNVIYYLREKWKGSPTCQEAQDYLKMISSRERQEIQNLKDLTGWENTHIQQELENNSRHPNNTKKNTTTKPNIEKKSLPWYKRFWK